MKLLWHDRPLHIRILMLIAAVLILITIGNLIQIRPSEQVRLYLECSPEPVGMVARCPPDDGRPVLVYVVPVDYARTEPHWRVMTYDEDMGWDDLFGTSWLRAHTWVELPMTAEGGNE